MRHVDGPLTLRIRGQLRGQPRHQRAHPSAMASMAPPPLGQTSLSDSASQTLAPTFATNWL